MSRKREVKGGGGGVDGEGVLLDDKLFWVVVIVLFSDLDLFYF